MKLIYSFIFSCSMALAQIGGGGGTGGSGGGTGGGGGGSAAGGAGAVQLNGIGKILTATVATGGSGYAPGDTGGICPYSICAATSIYTVLTVDGSGSVLTFSFTAGYGYGVGSGVVTAPFSGAGDGSFTVDIGSVSSTPVFSADSNVQYYPQGIPNPSVAPTVVALATGSTSYSYVVVELLGPVLTTTQSPTTTIANGAATPNNQITLPVVSDPNVFCFVEQTAPNSYASLLQRCDGSSITDTGPTGNLSVPFFQPAMANYTGSTIVIGGGASMNNEGFSPRMIQTTSAPAVVAITDPNFNDVTSLATDLRGNFYCGSYLDGCNFGANNFWQSVYTCGNMGDASPCQMLYDRQGFYKCDTSAGNVTIHLPVASTFPLIAYTYNGSYGLMLTVHKPFAANTCTIDTSDGTKIDDGFSVVLTTATSTWSGYWDNVHGDGNTAKWATSYNTQLVQAPILRGTSSALSGAITIGTCNTTTVAVTGATTGMVVEVSPVTNPDSGSAGLVRWDGYVSSSNTVTVRECGLGVVTPISTTYNVAVVP